MRKSFFFAFFFFPWYFSKTKYNLSNPNALLMMNFNLKLETINLSEENIESK